jgi:uncharacterized protein (TIGR03084 family)
MGVTSALLPVVCVSKPSVGSLLSDLRAEQREVRSFVEGLKPEGWRRLTTPGWTVRDQIAHLAFFDEKSVESIVDPEAFASQKKMALADTASYERSHLQTLPADGHAVLNAWRTSADGFCLAAEGANPSRRLQWFGPDMGLLSMITARLMETWAHGYDVADALGLRREPTARLRHIANLAFMARPQGYLVRDLPVPDEEIRVELVAPGGGLWAFGPADAEQRVHGPAEDFCLVLVRRRHVKDTALECDGATAREWMEIGQAYAGPPGAGPRRLSIGGKERADEQDEAR